jgi:hypothetical protein
MTNPQFTAYEALLSPPTPRRKTLSPFRATVFCHPTAHVTGTEQAVAGIFGFLTAGPVGYMASVATIRSTEGKWFPWFALGIVAAPILFWTQVLALGVFLQTADNAARTVQVQSR